MLQVRFGGQPGQIEMEAADHVDRHSFVNGLKRLSDASGPRGVIGGQVCVPGQVVLRDMGIGGIPVINVENACASASTALHQAAAMVSAGLYDVVLALGVEKLYHEDKKKSFGAFSGAVDVEAMAEIIERLREGAKSTGAKSASSGAGEKRSMFMDIYAMAARDGRPGSPLVTASIGLRVVGAAGIVALLLAESPAGAAAYWSFAIVDLLFAGLYAWFRR